MEKQSEGDLSQILKRAEEIHAESQGLMGMDTRYAEVVAAATEAGLPREAILQALRERLEQKSPTHDAEAGNIVFAKSSDGSFYGAVVVKTAGTMVRVRFLNGGEAAVGWPDLQPFTLTPGQAVQVVDKESGHFWWAAKVSRVNPVSRSVTVIQWGQEKTLPLEFVRIGPNTAANRWLSLLNNPIALAIGISTLAITILIFALSHINKDQMPKIKIENPGPSVSGPASAPKAPPPHPGPDSTGSEATGPGKTGQ